MGWSTQRGQGSGAWRVVAAAVVGAAVGLAGTAAALGSFEFGIFGAMGGSVAAMIAALAQLEPSEA